jgi:hypothetical protein
MTWVGLDVHARSTHGAAIDVMTGESSWGVWRLLALESKDGVHADRADSWEADDQAVFG